jgi:hypothetical protein
MQYIAISWQHYTILSNVYQFYNETVKKTAVILPIEDFNHQQEVN